MCFVLLLIFFFFFFFRLEIIFFCFFFFQAEDGIRDIGVTGVDVCSSDLTAPVTWPIGMGRDLKGIYHLQRSEEHTSELQSRQYLVCRLLLEKKKKKTI